MEDVEQRLKEATDNCLASHAEWTNNRKDSKARERLMEAVHELRKVAARLEIEIAISERDEMASKPIPIPPHRSKQRKSQEDFADDSSGIGNSGGGNGGGGGGSPQPSRGRRPRRTGTGPKES